MTTVEKIRMRFPDAIIVGGSGEWVILNHCHRPLRARLCPTEAAAREVLRTGVCTAPKCEGKHEVREFAPDPPIGDWHD